VLAQGAATPAGPLDLGNFRVGILPVVSTQLAVSNTTSGAGAERLALSSATASGNFSATNNLGSGLVLPGATSVGAVTIASSGGSVGVNSGSVALQFASNGQLFDGSFTQLATNQQTVGVQATGFLVAQPTLRPRSRSATSAS
jgi:alanine dehydrogenase